MSSPDDAVGPPGAETRTSGRGRFHPPQLWWRTHRGALARDAVVGLVVGIVLFLGAMVWDARLNNRQERLARDLADRAEVLENTRFVRQVAIDNVSGKPFSGLNLRGAQLGGLDLACEGDVTARRACAEFSEADLSDAKVYDANLAGANLMVADLTGTNLFRTHLAGANLTRADLTGAHMMLADLTSANLARSYLTGANLAGAILTGADLTRADLTDANLTHANLTHADLSGTNLTGAKGLTQRQIDAANGDGSTRLPAWFQRPSSWGLETPD